MTPQQAVVFDALGHEDASHGQRGPIAQRLGALLGADRVAYKDMYDNGECWSFYRGGDCFLTLKALGGRYSEPFLSVEFGGREVTP